MATFLLTTQQQVALATELNNDPESLGYAAFVEIDDFNNLQILLSCIRDGITPCPSNGVIGPGGVVSGATNATPIVITTSAPHGRANGDSVFIQNVGGNAAANGYFTIAGVTANTFQLQTPGSLNNVAGTGAYTSGGTWSWCVDGVRTQSVSQALVWEAINKADEVAGSAALTGLQQEEIAQAIGMLNAPSGTVEFSTSAGADTSELAIIKSMFTAGSPTVLALTALKYRIGSRIENLLGISNPITYLNNTGTAPTVDDIAQALGDTPP